MTSLGIFPSQLTFFFLHVKILSPYLCPLGLYNFLWYSTHITALVSFIAFIAK